MSPAEHYAWGEFYAAEVDALPRPWDTATRERAVALSVAGRLHLELAMQPHLAEPVPVCRDPHEVAIDVGTFSDPDTRMVVTVYCAKDAGHDPSMLDGGHRSLDGRDFW